MKILIVEDEVLLADSLKAALEQKGFTVETAYDGETGKEYAELGVYDLLILDVMMPKLNGFDLARQVRRSRCATPILMLTAKSELEDRIEREIIEGYDNLTVTALESDPTTCLVEFEFTVVHGLNRIFLTAHISV